MKIKIKVHANSSQEKIVKINEEEFEVWIKQKPIDGKANIFLEKLLKNYFKKSVKLIKGITSQIKIFEFIE
ncbi:MAG: DUF167 family protein [Candidatus Pacearchaeota archaeon]|jgi:uncharacterized protein (TIGR00251 family)